METSCLLQNGCLHGLLYVAEDPGSHVVPQLGPLLVKYLLPHLENFHRLHDFIHALCTFTVCFSPQLNRHTELHIRLVWSLSISLALVHSQHLKYVTFAVLLSKLISYICLLLLSFPLSIKRCRL